MSDTGAYRDSGAIYFQVTSVTRIFSFVLVLMLPMKMTLADASGQPRIIDGDTIEVFGERIRLHGIDTPETNQRCLDRSRKR